jgi:acyl-CoA synthetase (AMP-forming)/AMP-acid ligase II
MVPSFISDFACHGDAPALVFPNNWVITYAELARRVDEQAQRYGTGKRLVAVEARISEHAIIAYLAALKRGHAVALLPPNDAGTAERFEADFRPDHRCRMTDGRWRTEAADGLPPGELHRDLALLLSTSGSTGLSRWVRLSVGNLDANAAAIAGYLDLERSDRGALILPLHYCYGLSVLHAHLAVGASVFVAGKSILDSGFVADLRRTKCTNLAGVPYSYELLERIGFRAEHLPDLRFMTVAGGRLPPELVQRYNAHLSRDGKRFFVMYGQTEATSRIAFVPPERLADNTDRIGIAIPGGELRLVDDEGYAIEAEETPGELVYRGPNVMMGYAAGRADLARGAEIAELRTGDLAVRDHHGLYRITGRLRRMSKIAGLRIGHDALEQALAGHGIEAAVVGDDRSVLATYTSTHSEDEVRQLLVAASGLAPFHVKATTVDRLPRLESGKVDYERLKADLSDQPARRAENVQDVFRQAFFPHHIRESDSFTSLGGDSLRYVQLTIGLERALGHLPAGWEQKPISELATRQRREKSATQFLSTDLVVRALAVLLVVVHHATSWPIPIGAPAMVMLIGYSLARFQSSALFTGEVPRVLRPLLTVLAPYYLIVAGYAIAWGEVPWASVFLVGNFGIADPQDHTMVPFLYWFVEVYVQLMLIWTALFLIPAVRRWALRDPFAFGLAFLAAAMAARFIGPELWTIGGRQIFTIPWVLYLAIFGWCVVFADTPRKKLTLLAAGVIVFPLVAYFGGNWAGSWIRYMVQLLCLAVLLYAPHLRLPRTAVGLVLPVSAASYHIYLFHRFAPELILQPLEATLPQPVFTVVAVISGVALGLLAHEIQKIVVWRLSAAKATLSASANADRFGGGGRQVPHA